MGNNQPKQPPPSKALAKVEKPSSIQYTHPTYNYNNLGNVPESSRPPRPVTVTGSRVEYVSNNPSSTSTKTSPSLSKFKNPEISKSTSNLNTNKAGTNQNSGTTSGTTTTRIYPVLTIPENFGSSTNPPNFGNSTNPNLRSSTNPPNFGSSTNPPNFGNPTNPSNLRSSTNPSNLRSSTNPPNFGNSTNPPNFGNSTNPSNLRSSTNPQNLRTSTIPSLFDISTNPNSGSSSNPPNLKMNMNVANPSVKKLEQKIENLEINPGNRGNIDRLNIARAFSPPIVGHTLETVALQGSENKRGGHNNNNNNRGGRNRGRGGNNPNRGDHRGGGGGRGNNRGGNRGNRSRGNHNQNRGRNLGPGILPTPGTSQEMDWFNMAPRSSSVGPHSHPNPNFTANDLPMRHNYGGRYNNGPDDTKSESNKSCNRGRGGNRREGRPHFMGFKKLEEILQMEPDQIVVGLCSEEAGFEKLLKTELSNDYVVLVIRVISKCCRTTFQQNKAKILARVCEKDFADQLIKYLNEINLHDRQDKFRNKYFWNDNNKDLFWNDLIEFYESVIQLIPNTAVEVLPKMIKQTIMTVTNLETQEGITIPDIVKSNLEDLQLKLMLCVEEREKKNLPKPDLMQDEDPPDDFRQISLYPMVQEITDREEKVFLRANIVAGSYRNVEHYLDVHFRLLREDFVAPLRDGVCQHLSQQLSKERKRIFNVRFYEKVKFVSKYTVQDKVAIVIQLNVGKKKIKLENTRRFMFGSLLCFTRNNFQSVVFGTVVSRDRNLIASNQIAIDLINENVSYEAEYTMVECNVYFEPYYHVLKALQVMTEDKFPLKRYIIDVEPDVHPPKYLQEFSTFEHREHRFYALQKDRWPSANTLGLDNSQYRAFQAALTKEFCVIQGPPGTGKTYIGLRITQVLLENRELWNANRNPILVICFTNHALDQFLEGICAFTKKVVRIGGQSKNENLKAFNIREMRMKYNRTKQGNKLMYRQRDELRDIMGEIQRLQKIVNGIISCTRIIDIRGFEVIDERMRNTWFTSSKGSDLLDWLMGGRTVEERYQERRKQKLQQNAPPARNDEENEESDSEDEFFDPEEEAQREIDDVDDHIFGTHALSLINSSTLLTGNELQERINLLERQLADIEVKAEETNEFKVFDERGMIESALNKLYENFDYFNWRMDQLKSGNPPPRPLIVDYNNPHALTPNERWGLYAYWLALYRNSLIIKLNKLHEDYRQVYQQYEEVKQIEDIKLMKDMQVVGMTTCGAARYQTLLQALKCPIVIVEEAAEVLESHVVVSLTSDCQQLILIGDHKQLRPTTAEYRLRKECNLDVSLFERMVSNRIHCETLEVQHRMRPEIVKLIVPAIYPKLDSHPSVYTYPPVQGVAKNLYFITHTEPEEAVDDSGSRRNVHEAKFLIKLARHFRLQGYDAEDITILAAYSGQMFCLWKERKNVPLLKDVRITGVDNYQGEENKLILLSLVRSNSDSNIGFLKTDNRVNVALSRAKEGLFIIGNMSILERSDNAWPQIKRTLEESGQIGPYLTLQCQVHRDQLTAVRTADDFQKVTEGGCTQLCGSPLNCGHTCRSLCHVTDREHNEYKCKERCGRGLCEIGHPCPLKCYQQCMPCIVPLSVTLKCGHQHDLPCHMNDTSKYPCPTLVDTRLECGHVAPKPCHCDAKRFACPHPCDVRKPCGHACERRCHINDDPDHLKSKCFKKCERPSNGCTQLAEPHKCLRPCYEECMDCEVKVKKVRQPCGHIWTVPCRETVDDMKCTKRCKNKLSCGHDCKLECWETCGKCDVKVEKVIESCGHKVKTKCSEAADRKLCRGQCPRLLPCGHPCNKKCYEPCRTSCTALVDSPFNAACGHRFKIPCGRANQGVDANKLEVLKYCEEPCNEVLQCEHRCAGTCGACAQGRIHATCKEKCGATLICGHECDTPCREICQPCNKKCYYKCVHSKCGKKCGEPCAECKERCTRRCMHRECKRLCSEMCNVPPCNEPCPRLLRCKHPCIGFCGEPCPPVCRVCNQDDETFTCLFGAEDEPDARFVYLEECGHSIEADAMDTWMQQKPEADDNRPHEINVKCCPKCKTIIMTQRYSEYIKQVFKDIIAIKKKVYLEDTESSAQRAELQGKLATLRQDNLTLYKDLKYLESLTKEISNELKETRKGKRNPINKIDFDSCSIKIKLMQRLINILNNGNLKDNPELYSKCLKHFDFILSHLIAHESRISEQKLRDLELEISRFEKLVHLFTIEKNPNFAYSFTKEAIKTLYLYIKNKLDSIVKYSLKTDAEIKGYLEDLRLMVDKTISITEEEKEMIVKAVGLAKGRWFKCPNGHYFVIGECGGAMEVSRCNECGAAIGGRNHTLLETNQFGGEIDGAAHPAWSNAANMANYDFDEFN